MRFACKLSVLLISVMSGAPAVGGEWDVEVGGEYRYLPQDPPYGVGDDAVSASVRAEYFHDWNDGNDLFELDVFYRCRKPMMSVLTAIFRILPGFMWAMAGSCAVAYVRYSGA